ncbi:MAG: cytochrome c class [Acidobacteriaceae bacterium]|nr:cytochrome c class [Acidobacteriaceae bacterium]
MRIVFRSMKVQFRIGVGDVLPSASRNTQKAGLVSAITSAGLVLLLAGAVSALFTGPALALSKEKQEAAIALFHKTGCEYCHGPNGIKGEKAPDLSAVGKRRKREQIELQIMKGGNGMPAFGEVLPADDVKVLVDYLSSRKRAGH